jgi:hypothetical protein
MSPSPEEVEEGLGESLPDRPLSTEEAGEVERDLREPED